MIHHARAAALILLLVAGCKGGAEPAAVAPAAEPTPPPAAEGDEAGQPDAADAPGEAGFSEAPHPFTAEEIRAATREGRTYTFRVEAVGQPVTWREMRFTDVTDEGCTITHRQWTEGEQPEEMPSHTQTWEELWSHATYPAELSTLVEETITVPAGTYACTRYDVLSTGSKLLSTRAWFARELPGAPVKLEAYEDGELQITTVLEKHENPAR